ncbi:ABC transporter permease [Herbaspirillum sp. alder98]|uniref:ABC transporter permease n=1 Tax=Herbaspirillum sp. alder98 TaxID=2913096 RepID=UPI001CD8703B|nr:ABC transporter permease [Herbaspirillum sp. alder98]MCA1326404.1 ABC transporter permease [Herbaspirillum sp. alder98]
MMPRFPGPLVVISAVLVLMFLALPILIIFPLALTSSDYLSFPPPGWSLKWIISILTDSAWLSSIWFSLKIAVASTLLSVVISLGAALALVRYQFRGKQAVYALILLPMIVPNVISAMAMFFFFGDIKLDGLLSIVVGHAVVSIPVAVIILSATLQGFDSRLENAALSLGASRWTAFRRITLPIIAPGLMSACIFAFLSSFDELLIALFLAGSSGQTLPVRIWNAVLFQLDPKIAAVSAFLVLVSIIALLAANFVGRRK